MKKTYEELEAALEREIAYAMKLNEKIMALQERLKSFISKEEHQKAIELLKRQHEVEMSKINFQHLRAHNERRAGRKKIATREVIARVLELRNQGLSQAKISDKLTQELGVKIGRTTIGEIVRGNYVLSDGE